MDSKILLEKRGEVLKDMQELVDKVNTGDIELNEDDNKKIDELSLKADELSTQIERALKVETQLKEAAKVSGTTVTRNEGQTDSDYSFFKHVRDYMGGNLTGKEAEVQQEAENEKRGFGKSIAGIGIPASMINQEKRADITSNIAGTSVEAYVDALKQGGTYEEVGATILRGLTGDARIPVTGDNSVAWAATENAGAADGGAAFSSVTLSPSRLTSKVNVSRELLAQNGTGAEAAVLRDLGRATAEAIDQAIFNDSTISNAPDSIGATSGVGTFTEATFTGGSSCASDLIEAEQTLALAKALKGNMRYVVSPELIGQLKISAQVASVTPAMTTMNPGYVQMINGYPIHFSNGCGRSAGVNGHGYFGDFSNLYIGYWGGVDILIDPYTNADANQIRLILNTLVDWQLPQPASFVKFTSLVA